MQAKLSLIHAVSSLSSWKIATKMSIQAGVYTVSKTFMPSGDNYKSNKCGNSF